MTIKWKTEGAMLQAREHWDSFPEYVSGVATKDDKKIDEHPLNGVARYE